MYIKYVCVCRNKLIARLKYKMRIKFWIYDERTHNRQEFKLPFIVFWNSEDLSCILLIHPSHNQNDLKNKLKVRLKKHSC